MKPILKWQYEQIIKELLLLQEHASDPSCPCETENEMCFRKHLFLIEAYAQETLTIEEDEEMNGKLERLSKEAREFRRMQEKVLRGEDVELPIDLAHWTRDWRKAFETYSLEAPEMEEAETS